MKVTWMYFSDILTNFVELDSFSHHLHEAFYFSVLWDNWNIQVLELSEDNVVHQWQQNLNSKLSISVLDK